MYCRNLFRSWCAANTFAPFYDTINQEQDPQDNVWFTAEFFAFDNSKLTFCAGDYQEAGTIDVVFFAQPGQGDNPILTAMEPAINELLQQVDPSGKMEITGHSPVEEISSGSADNFYRLVVGIDYTYTA